MKTRTARVVLGVVMGLAVVELGAAALAYRDRIDADDWSRAREALAEIPPDEPVYLADPWLGPRARMELPRLAAHPSVGRPDLRGTPHYWVLGLGARRWSDELQEDLEDLPPPVSTEPIELGDLTLTRYAQPQAGVTVGTLRDANTLKVTTERGPCRTGRGAEATRWRCEEGTVTDQYAEIDYRPRRCLAFDLADGGQATASARMRTGNVLRGHVGMTDYNARLRSDAPVTITLISDHKVLGRWTVTDDQGWFSIAARIQPGTHDVELTVQSTASGTWGRGGYASRPSRPVCVELRTLTEESPA